jgi:hypothetical protein
MVSGNLQEIILEVAQIPVSFRVEDRNLAERLRAQYAEFLSPGSWPVVSIDLRIQDGAQFLPVEPGPWQIRVLMKDHHLLFESYYESGWVDLSCGAGELIISHRASVENFLRALYAHLAVERGALLVHASGIIRKKRAFVFFGPSGSGKTTTARLSPDHIVLSDDLVLLRRVNGGAVAFGVPFRGELLETPRHNLAAEVAGIFRLRKDHQHFIERLEPSRALAELLACVPFVMSTAESMRRVVSLGSQLLATMPIRELHFRRDAGFWETIESA